LKSLTPQKQLPASAFQAPSSFRDKPLLKILNGITPFANTSKSVTHRVESHASVMAQKLHQTFFRRLQILEKQIVIKIFFVWLSF